MVIILFSCKEAFPGGTGELMSLEQPSKKKATNKCTDASAWLLVSVGWFLRKPSGIEPQLPTWINTCYWLFFPSHLIFFNSSLGYSGIFQINFLHTNICIRVCFEANSNQKIWQVITWESIFKKTIGNMGQGDPYEQRMNIVILVM